MEASVNEARKAGKANEKVTPGSTSSSTRSPWTAAKGTPSGKIGPGNHTLTTANTSTNTSTTPGRRVRPGIFIPECWDNMRERPECIPDTPNDTTTADPTNPSRPAAPAPRPPTRAEAETIARTLIARLDLPDTHPSIHPAPDTNEWNTAIVGIPYQLRADSPTTLNTTVTGYGITITLHATRTHIVFDTGDGNTVTCTTTDPHPPKTTHTATPPCGHTYTWPSRHKNKPHGTYPLTATTHWTVAWTALGHNGTIPVTITNHTNIPVSELHTLARTP